MQCQDVEALLPGYLDDELDLMQSIEVEKHLDVCTRCRQEIARQRALQTAMRAGGLYREPRPTLQRDILRSVQKQERVTAPRITQRGRRISLLTAFAAAMLLAGWSIGRFHATPLQNTPSETELLANEAFSGHVRSLMANHLVDVVSSDRHTVKPWFNDKVDYSPPVIDLADQGFPLTGGRLDYLDGRPVTALVYRRQKHVLNLFLWPVATPDTGAALLSRQGYNMIHWTRSRLAYWVVSDLNATELHAFAAQYQERVALANRP